MRSSFAPLYNNIFVSPMFRSNQMHESHVMTEANGANKHNLDDQWHEQFFLHHWLFHFTARLYT